MSLIKLNFFINQKDLTRAQIRKIVVEKFLEESPGPADDETYNRYQYAVEHTSKGDVVLIRPANLKLGFDFRIDVLGMKFIRGTEAPSHEDLFEDLKLKHTKDPVYAELVRKAIIDVFYMAEPEEIISSITEKKIGLPVDLLLKVSKWLAIEQDIRYWNGWGRVKNIKWLELIKYFNYQVHIEKKGKTRVLLFGDNLSEEKALKIMDNSQQQLH